MKKNKIIFMGVAVVGLLLFLLANKYFAFNFKKGIEETIQVPAWKESQVISNEDYMAYTDIYALKKDTSKLKGAQGRYYSKYIDYMAPNGKPIRILAMDKVSDDQVLYAYDLLCFYLEENLSPHKVEIANKMADNKAILILPNGSDRDGKTPMAAMALGQNLNQNEIANIGSSWYMTNDYSHRDAAFEEIFHMVHDYGIGTTGKGQADKVTSQSIYKASVNALPTSKDQWGKTGLWGLGSKAWLKELSKEGSLEQEYIASVIDSYYGLWAPWTEQAGGMWGIYVAKDRPEIEEKDPEGLKAIEAFLPKNLSRMMRIDSTFTGDFHMSLIGDKAYTHKSQYLRYASLSGDKDANLYGNAYDNVLMGNSGSNIIDGGQGRDALQLRGPLSAYTIKKDGDGYKVSDSVLQRDGIIYTRNIDYIYGTDKSMTLE